MQAYRLYRLDGAGKIISADWIQADGDESAIEEVLNQVDGAKFELWQGPRLIGRRYASGVER